MLPAAFVGGVLGYYLLKWLGAKAARGEGYCSSTVYQGRRKLEVLFGPAVWENFTGKVVIDFGCGTGGEAVEMARHGAQRVIGVDIQQRFLDFSKAEAKKAGVSDRCVFAMHTAEKADFILSLDGFEHYDDPEGALRAIRSLIKGDGKVLICFGPTWFHLYGGHLFSVFPWAHLLFTERALIRWRSDFKTDGATRFCEVEGGLNQMTVRRFRQLIAQSDFEIESFELIPSRKLRLLHNRLTQEFLTASVRCQLSPRKAINKTSKAVDKAA